MAVQHVCRSQILSDPLSQSHSGNYPSGHRTRRSTLGGGAPRCRSGSPSRACRWGLKSCEENHQWSRMSIKDPSLNYSNSPEHYCD